MNATPLKVAVAGAGMISWHHLAVFLATQHGAPVEVVGTMAAPGYPPRPSDRLELAGTKASVIFDDWTLQLRGPSPRTRRYDPDQGYQDSFDAVIGHFVECLRAGAPFETDAEENLATLRIVEDAYAAAASGS